MAADLAQDSMGESILEEVAATALPAAEPPPEPPAKIVELENVPPPEPDAQTVNTEDVVTAAANNERTSNAAKPVGSANATPRSKTSSKNGSKNASRRTTPQLKGDAGGKLPEIMTPASQTPPIRKPLHVCANTKKPESGGLPSIRNGNGNGSGNGNRLGPPNRRNVSPGRGGRAPPGPPNGSQEGSAEGTPGRARSLSPGGGNWNLYNKATVKARREIKITGPSDEEKAQRRQWAIEANRRKKAAIQAVEEDEAGSIARKNEENAIRLDARRGAIRERIAKQHEIAAKLAIEKQAADEKAKQELHKFRGKPLHLRLIEEYEENKKKDEEEAKKRYEEEVAAMKHVRPHQLISGEVVVKPPPGKELSPVRDRGVVSGRSPARRSVQYPGMASAMDGDADLVVDGGAPAVETKKGRGNGPVLYSTRAKQPAKSKAPKFEERAVSPFIFDTELGVPVNVPDQSSFWTGSSTHPPDTLEVDIGAHPLETVEEGNDMPLMSSPTGSGVRGSVGNLASSARMSHKEDAFKEADLADNASGQQPAVYSSHDGAELAVAAAAGMAAGAVGGVVAGEALDAYRNGMGVGEGLGEDGELGIRGEEAAEVSGELQGQVEGAEGGEVGEGGEGVIAAAAEDEATDVSREAPPMDEDQDGDMPREAPPMVEDDPEDVPEDVADEVEEVPVLEVGGTDAGAPEPELETAEDNAFEVGGDLEGELETYHEAGDEAQLELGGTTADSLAASAEMEVPTLAVA